MASLSMKRGRLSLHQINLMLSTLPVDLTFVDENGVIRYYSQKKDLIFGRDPRIIGTTVQSCHSQGSVPMVNKIIAEFKKGKRDSASFWIKKDKRFIYVRYLRISGKDNGYRGILEVAQDVTRIKGLRGLQMKPKWD